MTLLETVKGLILREQTDELLICLKDLKKIIEDRRTSQKRNILTDELALTLLPSDIPFKECTPAKTTGNGNCLFNAASIYIQGDETLSEVLRAATAITLHCYAEQLGQHECFESAQHHSDSTLTLDSYRAISLTEDISQYFNVDMSFQDAIRKMGLKTCDNNSWSSFMHILALSLVLERPIWSVYPEANKGLRPLLHRKISFTSEVGKTPICIMWTRDGNLDTRTGTVFEPNHFVPILLNENNSANEFDSDDDYLLNCMDDTNMTSVTQDIASKVISPNTNLFKHDTVCLQQTAERTQTQHFEQDAKGKTSQTKTTPFTLCTRNPLQTEDNLVPGDKSMINSDGLTVDEGIPQHRLDKDCSDTTTECVTKYQCPNVAAEHTEDLLDNEVEHVTSSGSQFECNEFKSMDQMPQKALQNIDMEGSDKLVACENNLAEIETKVGNKPVTENNDKCDTDKNTLTDMPLEELGESVSGAETKFSTSINAQFDRDDFTVIDEFAEKEETKIFRELENKTSDINTGVDVNEIFSSNIQLPQDGQTEMLTNIQFTQDTKDNDAYHSDEGEHKTEMQSKNIKNKLTKTPDKGDDGTCNEKRNEKSTFTDKMLGTEHTAMFTTTEGQRAACNYDLYDTDGYTTTATDDEIPLIDLVEKFMNATDKPVSSSSDGLTTTAKMPINELAINLTKNENKCVASDYNDIRGFDVSTNLDEMPMKISDRNTSNDDMASKAEKLTQAADQVCEGDHDIFTTDTCETKDKIPPKKLDENISKEKRDINFEQQCNPGYTDTKESSITWHKNQTSNQSDDFSTTDEIPLNQFVGKTKITQQKLQNCKKTNLAGKKRPQRAFSADVLKSAKKQVRMNSEMLVQWDQHKMSSRSEKITNNPQIEQSEETSSSESESDEAFESDVELESEWETSDESDEEIEVDEESGSIQWLSRLHKIENKAFLGPTPGPSKAFSAANLPLNFFYEIFPEEIFQLIVKSTNDYIPIYTAQRQKFNPTWTEKAFTPVTTDVMKAYFGIRMIKAIDPKPSIDDYWSSNPSLKNSRIADTMTRQKFKLIQRYFHINDPKRDPVRITDPSEAKEVVRKDPLYKVSPLLEKVRRNSNRLYNLHQEVSIDEAMIKCHGQHWGIVGAPNKPAKRGFKIFVCADAVSGYTSNFQVYMRKQKETGLTQKVVENLTEEIYNRNHIIFVDKFYTSVPLALSLLQNSTYLCGSFNVGRKNWPQDLKESKKLKKKEDKVKSLKRGEFLTRQTKDKKLVATVWKDKRAVYNLSTCYDPVTNVRSNTVTRRHINEEGKWVKGDIPCPKAIVEFNKFMGGVDRHDHLRSSYTLQRSSNRWWTYFAWFGVDMALINSYILYKSIHKKKTHKQFHLEVAEQLIGGYSDRLRQARQSDPESLSQTAISSHQSVSFKGRAKACRYCIKMKTKTEGGRTRETTFGCAQCNVNLHKPCFIAYHHLFERKVSSVDKGVQTGDCLLTPTKDRKSVQTALKDAGKRTATKRRITTESADIIGRRERKSPRKKNYIPKYSK